VQYGGNNNEEQNGSFAGFELQHKNIHK
jgi:hypothetical protein